MQKHLRKWDIFYFENGDAEVYFGGNQFKRRPCVVLSVVGDNVVFISLTTVKEISFDGKSFFHNIPLKTVLVKNKITNEYISNFANIYHVSTMNKRKVKWFAKEQRIFVEDREYLWNEMLKVHKFK